MRCGASTRRSSPSADAVGPRLASRPALLYARRFCGRVLAEESEERPAVDVDEAATPQDIQDRLRRNALVDRVPVVLHEELGRLASRADSRHQGQDVLEMDPDQPAGYGRVRTGHLEEKQAPARLQDTAVLPERHLEVGHVAQGEAHAEHVEQVVAERQRLGSALDEGAGERLSRFPQHAAARIDADHPTGLAEDAHRAVRHQARAGRDVEQPHPGTEARAAKSPAAVPGTRAQVQHCADAVVVSGGAVEQRADERLSVSVARVVLLQDGVGRCRFGHGPVIVSGSAGSVSRSTPHCQPVNVLGTGPAPPRRPARAGEDQSAAAMSSRTFFSASWSGAWISSSLSIHRMRSCFQTRRSTVTCVRVGSSALMATRSRWRVPLA